MKKIVCFLGVLLFSITLFLPAAQAKTFKYTSADIKLIARVVYAESRNQPYLGKIAVALVVINRYESGIYGKTLAMVTRKGQFCKSVRTSQTCINAVKWAIKNRVLPKNTFYFQRSKSLFWGGRKRIIRYCRIGAHSFYTLGKAKSVTGDRYIDKNGKLVERKKP